MHNVELSVVIPCLNEALTITRCVEKARGFMTAAGIDGEVIVADNGSVDGSQELARRAGARVVDIIEPGYGAALRGGIAHARGRYVVMGDADDSYDFSDLEGFVNKLREGFQLVVGNRFAGGIQKGAMPFLHRYLGNPVLSFFGRLFFGVRIRDFHCGLRGFNREAIMRLGLNTTGMEFASEMVVKAALAGLRITEVPTVLSKDGRDRPPHLRTWRDGWRHLRFLLIFSPRWLFLYPGISLFTLGIGLQGLLYQGGFQLGGIGLDIHTMLYSSAMAVMGVQMIWFAVFARVFGARVGLLPGDEKVERAVRSLTLERGIAIGIALLLGGFVLSIGAVQTWAEVHYGPLDPRDVMRRAIPSVTMLLLGMEFVLASFFLGMLRFESTADSLAKQRSQAARSVNGTVTESVAPIGVE